MNKKPVPEKYVLGLIAKYKNNGVLYVHRSKSSLEYKNFWSLPTITVDEETYKNILKEKNLSSEYINKLSQEKLGGTSIIGGELFISGVRKRTNYIINISLFNVSLVNLPQQLNPKYDNYSILQPKEVISKNKGFCGTCISLYFQGLINNDILPSTFSYLEIPPEIADSERPIVEYTTAELWKLASPNYTLLLSDKTGGEGYLIRRLTLDRFLEDFSNNHIDQSSQVLDMGCGIGNLFKLILQKTTNISGIDLYVDFNCTDEFKNRIKKGDISNSDQLFENNSFDIIFLNLMVFWLPDLNSVCSCIEKILKPSGHIIVTMTHPEYTKNGEWKKVGDDYYWITKEPLKRDRFLTMINRCVGPLWFYPKTTSELIKIFSKNNFHCVDSEEIFLNSYLSKEEVNSILLKHPSLKRHLKIPNFVVYVFKKSK